MTNTTTQMHCPQENKDVQITIQKKRHPTQQHIQTTAHVFCDSIQECQKKYKGIDNIPEGCLMKQ